MMLKNFGTAVFLRLFLCLVALCFYGADAMDLAIIPKSEDVVWKLFFTHNRDTLAHADEHSFAQTSRKNCALIHAVQDQRKDCVYNYMVKNNIKLSTNAHCVYHKSGRIFGVIDIVAKKEDEALSSLRRLRMFSYELHGSALPVCQIAFWDNFKAKLPHNPSPFFNKNKQLCFYGLQEVLYDDPDFSPEPVIWSRFVEHTISEELAYKLLIPEKHFEELYIGLAEFLKFPVLLKNILDADGSTIESFGYPAFPKSKVYHIHKVKLSDNYKYFQEVSGVNSWITSFDDLSHRIRKALARHYEEQKK